MARADACRNRPFLGSKSCEFQGGRKRRRGKTGGLIFAFRNFLERFGRAFEAAFRCLSVSFNKVFDLRVFRSPVWRTFPACFVPFGKTFLCSLTAGNDLRAWITRRDFSSFFGSAMLIAGLFFRNFFSGFEKFADFCTNLRIIRKFSAKSATGATGAKHAKKFFILITRRSGVQVSPPQP